MHQNHLPEIKTERLSLRRLTQSDWEMISYLRSDKQVNQFVKRPSTETKEKALAFISKIDKSVKSNDVYYWAITEIQDDNMIGSICLWNFSKDQKTAEVGYDLIPTFQGKGLMSEALNTILNFGMNSLVLEVIEAYTHRENDSSKKLLKKAGFRLIPDKKDADNADNLVYEINNSTIRKKSSSV